MRESNLQPPHWNYVVLSITPHGVTCLNDNTEGEGLDITRRVRRIIKHYSPQVCQTLDKLIYGLMMKTENDESSELVRLLMVIRALVFIFNIGNNLQCFQYIHCKLWIMEGCKDNFEK